MRVVRRATTEEATKAAGVDDGRAVRAAADGGRRAAGPLRRRGGRLPHDPHVTLAATLVDEREWSDARLAVPYGQRWPIGTCFNHLKTSLKMDVLNCEAVDGVLKELAAYLIAYNLVRLVMLKAAQQQGVAIDRVGFADAARAPATQSLDA